MKYTITFFLIAGCVCWLSAQTAVSGKLLNSQQEPIEFATIALLTSTDSTVVKGSYTNDRGEYLIENVKAGNYFIRSSVVGMGNINSPSFNIDEGKATFRVNDLQYATMSTELKAAEVAAVKPVVEFKNGNTILNVDNTALAAGNNAYDLFIKAPGVSIDNNNNISIQGKQGVKVMIDGRMQQMSNEQLANMLKSLGAEGIDKIEILKNPSSKYDAEGTAGIINIKTKKAKQIGFNGTVTAGVNRGELWGGNLGASLNYKGRKGSVFSSVNRTQRNRMKQITLIRNVGAGENEIIFNQTGKGSELSQPWDYKIGSDWYASDKTILGIVYDGANSRLTGKTDNTTQIAGNNPLGFDYLQAIGNSPSNWNNHNLNLNGQHKFDTSGTQLDVSFDYTQYAETGNNSYSNRFYNLQNEEISTAIMFPNIYNNNTQTDIRIITGKADFTKKLCSKMLLESGLKYSHVNTENELLFERKDTLSETFYKDVNYSNQFRYTEAVSAGYVSVQYQIPHGNLNLGLRGEHTHAVGLNITRDLKTTRDYFQLFPNIGIDYGTSDKHQFQFSYSRRINRPDYFQLNPFKFYLDQYTSSEGNPFLNPEKSHNLSFTYVFQQFLNNTLSYQRTADAIVELTLQDDASKETKQVVRNIKASQTYAYDVSAYIPVQKWWTSRLNISGWYMHFNGDVNGTTYQRGQFGGSANLFNEFQLPKNFVVELSGNYRTPLLWSIFQIGSQGSVDLGVRKTFFDRKLSVKLGISDMFYTMNNRVKVDFDNQHLHLRQLQDTRRVRFSLTYNFGNSKFRLRDTKSNEAEKGRLKNK